MSKEELIECIKTHHKDEVEDHNKYTTMDQNAYELDMDYAAGILNDIARDENTHAKALEYILEKCK